MPGEVSVAAHRDHLIGAVRHVIYPGIERVSRGHPEVRVIWNGHHPAHAVKAERRSYHAGRESRSPLQRAVVAVLYIVGIAISWPPRDHVWWRRHAPWEWAGRGQPRRRCSSDCVTEGNWKTHRTKSRAAVCICRDVSRAEEMLPLTEPKRIACRTGEELNPEHCARHAIQSSGQRHAAAATSG